MSPKEYLDFDLAIEPATDGFVARVLRSPAGEASAHFAAPFSDQEIEEFLLRCSGDPDIDPGSDELAARTFGGRLFDAVIAGEVAECYRRSRDKAGPPLAGLRIRLRLNNVPTLAGWPWEYLYDTRRKQFLALTDKTPVVRYLELGQSADPIAIDLPLRVLMVVSNPTAGEPDRILDVNRESDEMTKALAALEKSGRVTVVRQDSATLPELRRLLREGEYHIFHLIGHGGFDEQRQDGLVVLQDGNREVNVSAEQLGTVLQDHQSLRLAVLNTCEGARGSRNDPFAGTAQSLVQKGLPAVIAMQFTVTDEAAICFTSEFYSSLAAGYPVDAALAEARKAISSDVNSIEWGTPVLYMRSPDGRLFDVGRNVPPPPVPPPAATPTPTPAQGHLRVEADAATATDTSVDDEAVAGDTTTGVRDAFVSGIFDDAAAIRCVVVTPEDRGDRSATPLVQHVRRAWEHFGPQIVAAANQYRAASHLPPVPAADGPDPDFVLAELPVARAFVSEAALEAAIAALCKAELAVFDLTSFEPGILFLLGIRAVARRGVTLSSIGGAHTIGAELTVPFNLQLVNLSAHSSSQEEAPEGLRPWDLIGAKLQNGYRELGNLPHYLDLPAYEYVRQFGVESEAYQPIQYSDKVLVLCPFSQGYTKRNWRRFIAAELPGALTRRLLRSGNTKATSPRLERLLDLETPRLVAQTLFESIRLTEMCLIDWTDLRPNVMFEAGVRHATNPLGAVHISEDGADGLPKTASPLAQVGDMRRLFSPIGYRCRPGDIAAYGQMIDRFEAALAANREGRTGFVYRAVGESLDRRSHPAAPPLVEDLLRSANLLESDDQESTGLSPVLYHEVNKELVAESRAAAAERRLAAWLFISRRDTPERIAGDPRLRDQFVLLSLQTRRWARRAGNKTLISEIRTYEREVRRAAPPAGIEIAFNPAQELVRLASRVKMHKEEAKDLREEGDLAGAIDTLHDAVTALSASPLERGLLVLTSPATAPEKALAAHLADCLGMMGGNYRRLNLFAEALAAFERGRLYEESDRLDLSSSYNLVNAITLPLEMRTTTVTEQKPALMRAVSAIDRQVRGARRNDRWAWADLGQCQLLLGDLPAAAVSYQRARALGDNDTVTSIVDVLRRLSGAVEGSDPAAAESLLQGVALIGHLTE